MVLSYRRASLIDLYLRAIFHSNRRNLLWTDGRTHLQTLEIGFITSTLSKSRRKNYEVQH